MAGRPMRRTMLAQLESLARREGEDTLPEDVVLSRIESGETLIEIADYLSRLAKTRISRATLSQWMNETPERKARTTAARKASAPALVEKAVDILDTAAESRDSIAKAKAQADLWTWMASKYDRQTFGNDAAQVHVNVSMGDLHLDALRQRTVPTVTVPPSLPAGPDYEVVSDGTA